MRKKMDTLRTVLKVTMAREYFQPEALVEVTVFIINLLSGWCFGIVFIIVT